jgi:hypothetical protein
MTVGAPPVTADTNFVRLGYSIEPDTLWGADPGTGGQAPKGYEFPYTGESLESGKATRTPDTIRQDRMRASVTELGVSAQGSVNFELMFRDLEAPLAVALANDWAYAVNRTVATGDSAVTSSNSRLGIGTGGTAEFVAGADIWVSGYTNPANNGRHNIVSVGANYLQVSGNTLVDETNTGAVTIKSPKRAYTSGVFSDPNSGGIRRQLVVASADFIAMGVAVGQIVGTSGAANTANNGTFRVSAVVSATTLQFAGSAPFVSETVAMKFSHRNQEEVAADREALLRRRVLSHLLPRLPHRFGEPTRRRAGCRDRSLHRDGPRGSRQRGDHLRPVPTLGSRRDY